MQLSHRDGPIVILGASYAGGWPLDRVGSRKVVNKGVSGQQSFELLERFDRDVLPQQPRAVVVWGFINDVFRSARPQMAQTLERTRASFSEIVSRARANGIEPILATEITVRGPNSWRESLAVFAARLLHKPGYTDYINRQVLDTNTWLREYSRQEGILVLDLQPLIADHYGWRDRRYAADDGSHINPAGYERLSSYATPRLQDHLEQSR